MKYKLTDETKTLQNGTILRRIEAIKSFSDVTKEAIFLLVQPKVPK